MNTQIYSMQEIDEDKTGLQEKYDYWVMAPNIEERSREAYKKMRDRAIISNRIMFDCPNFHVNLSEEQEGVLNDFLYVDVDSVVIRAENEINMLQKFCELPINKESKIAVEITGFSIPNIFLIMHALKNKMKVKKVDAYYTEPQYYIYDKGYYDAYHSYVAERICRPILGYYNSGDQEEEVLTIFMGFDGGLAASVYFKLAEESQEIKDTYVVNGLPSYSPKLKDVSLYNNYDLVTKLTNRQLLCVAANSPFSAYNVLRDLYQKCKGVPFNICTIGSKPVALGACLFALDYKEKVKVTYPFYEKTKFDSDEKAGKVWRYTLDLN